MYMYVYLACRLLGHSTAADVLQLTNTFSTQAANHTRVVLARDRLGSEDDMFEELFQVKLMFVLSKF